MTESAAADASGAQDAPGETPAGTGAASGVPGEASYAQGDPQEDSAFSASENGAGSGSGHGPVGGDGPASGAGSASGDGSADAPEKQKKSGRNLPIAVGVGVTLGGLVLLSLYTFKQIFLAVMVVFLLLGLRELSEAFRTRGIEVPFIPLAAGMVAAPVVSYVWGTKGLVAAVALTTLAVLVTRMVDGSDGYVRDVTAGVFAVGYLVLMGGIVALLMKPDDGDHRIVIFIAVTVASDIGGFFAGSFLGKHKLAPTISPKKTWEGVTGSALTCMLVGGVLVAVLLDDGQWWQGVVIGLAAVVTATVGDLIESMLKRDLGIKDMGTLLPEHGGVMDRLDSLVATAPIVWLLLELFVPA
ncbi:phosphatidate cytidylyltransferase [Actinomadura rupiterrae]|uniref:phosphatidate cytidylyltransferase n=1 Tax=Actinomadura rupiterrae TaxID=559627 RepID=UPI0020A276F5|nr:phosphatidate cytidylyltransferase [Actinomadura rupiterrae]MCP2339703.1 phosphatidate cytidylyltransferase [Actinomadura rupiterrae]